MSPEDFFIPEWISSVTLPDASTVDGIFENQSQQVFDINATAPRVALLATDAAKINDKNSIWIDDIEYIAKDREIDDEGIVIIHLQTV